MNLGTAAGKAKIFGTIIGIGGAMVLTFFKGAEIDFLSTHINLLHHEPYQNQNGHVAPAHPTSGRNTLFGALLAFVGVLSYALWLIIQVIGFVTLSMTSVMSFSFSFFYSHS